MTTLVTRQEGTLRPSLTKTPYNALCVNSHQIDQTALLVAGAYKLSCAAANKHQSLSNGQEVGYSRRYSETRLEPKQIHRPYLYSGITEPAP